MLQLVREGGVIETVRASGHAARGFNRLTQNPGTTSSIAVPLFRDDAIAGALTLAFFSSAIQIDAAIRQLLPKLQACAAAITEDLNTGAADHHRHSRRAEERRDGKECGGPCKSRLSTS